MRGSGTIARLWLVLGLLARLGETAEQPSATVYTAWPFDAAEAKRRQEETAKALGVKVEDELDLGSGLKMKLVLIPAGEFQMGDSQKPEDIARRWPRAPVSYHRSAQPRHLVRITKPFYLGKTEVTRGHFARFVGETSYRTEPEKGGEADVFRPPDRLVPAAGASWRNPGYAQADDHPVVLLSWNDALAFCQWLFSKSGRATSLPTEAQWEYACRAGSDGLFPWGDGEEGAQGKANVASEGDGQPGRWQFPFRFRGVRDGYTFTAPVASFANGVNAFGLHDMIGNVYEWVTDGFYERFYEQSPKDDPAAPPSSRMTVHRGGGWITEPGDARSASRCFMPPWMSHATDGFRVAVAVRPGEAAGPIAKLEPNYGVKARPGVRVTPPEVYTAWPFDEKEAKRRQDETAKALGTRPEETLDLGGGAKLTLVLIPAGKFMMGDTVAPAEAAKRWPGAKADWFADAHPRHPVTLTKPFYASKTEITRGQFAQFVRETGHKTDAENADKAWAYQGRMWATAAGLSWRSPGFPQSDDHPVVCVSWNDAMAFCDWLFNKTGVRFALPTEAQWEYACRAGSDGAWPWGDLEAGAQGKANVASEGDGEPGKCEFVHPFQGVRDGYTYTAPAGKLALMKNAFGLQDMIGNVWEWCSDLYAAGYPGTTPRTDPEGPAEGFPNVVRGGSWCGYPWGTRAPSRAQHDPTLACTDGGFRVVMRAPERVVLLDEPIPPTVVLPPTPVATPPVPPTVPVVPPVVPPEPVAPPVVPPEPVVPPTEPPGMERLPVGQEWFVVLTWDRPGDMDLHIVEPSGERCWYRHMRTRTGGSLNQDDTSGQGPEAYTLGGGRLVGPYQIQACYYRGRAPVNATVWVYRGYGRPDQRLVGQFRLPVASASRNRWLQVVTAHLPSLEFTNIGPGVVRER